MAKGSATAGIVVGLLLAAGRSTRFGSNKLCHLLPGEVPIAVRSAQHLQAGVGNVLAVVRADDSVLAGYLRAAGIESVVCAEAGEGMAATIVCGVAASKDAGGWVIALADMPYIEPRTIAAVRVAVAHGELLAAPYFHGRRGHPVGFGACLADELLSLSGDEGARRVIAKHATRLHRIDREDAGVLADIDVPADLQRSFEPDDR